tara:strand:+ start:468 stop:1763 length:1296 start_codon:yes stop_codon:yes gene_type:complete
MSIKLINNRSKKKLNNEIKKILSDNNIFYESSILKDLSFLKTYTIDDEDSIEIDDAISLERVDNSYKLWIHIASPAVHIDYNSAIDRSARKFISTLYLSNNTIYMLPEILIKKIFSLTINEKRSSLSLGVIFNDDGSVSSFEIVQSLIKANFQLSYEDADELIDYAPKEEEDLSIILNILLKRKSWRKKLGAKEILESYGKIQVNNNIPSIKIIDQTLSRILISEAMILYGDLISTFTKKNNIPVPYRVQANSFNISNDNKNLIKNSILYNYQLKRRMPKTYYSISTQRHFSLGLNSYLHATSPIRRYADLLVHYQINNFLNNSVLISNEEMKDNITKINNLSKQNIIKYREDQNIWKNKLFEINSTKTYTVIFLDWINRYKNIGIFYFIEYNFSLICHFKSKNKINFGEMITIKDITNDYSDILYFKLNL